MWNKDTGRMYAHNLISWHKDEQITLEQAQQGPEEAEKQARQVVARAEREKKRADVEVQRANLNSEERIPFEETDTDYKQLQLNMNQGI